MVFHGDPGALMGTSQPLADGTRVRLRVLAYSDVRELRRRLVSAGPDNDLLRLGRLERADPRTQVVLSARAFLGGSERLVGVGSIALADPRSEPEIAWSDEELAPGVGALLRAALVGRAASLVRARAA